MKVIVLASVLASTFSAYAFADNSVCGAISDLNLPSYTIQVQAEDGTVLPEVPASSVQLSMYESVWTGDHWGSKDASISLSVTYDKNSGTYHTQAMDVKVPSHWKGLNPSCLDVIYSYNVSFNFFPKTAVGYDLTRGHQNFRYLFPESANFQLPDASKTQIVTLPTLKTITGVFTDNTHIVDASGKSITVSYDGPASAPIDDFSSFITEDEFHKIQLSETTSTSITVYGEDGVGQFIVENIPL